MGESDTLVVHTFYGDHFRNDPRIDKPTYIDIDNPVTRDEMVEHVKEVRQQRVCS